MIVRAGKIYVRDRIVFIFKKSMFPAMTVINDLIGNGDMGGRHFRGDSANCGNGDDLFDAQMLEAPDIGAVIDFMRRDSMGIAVPGQKYYFPAVKFAGNEIG